LIRCLCDYLARLLGDLSVPNLFATSPVVEFRPSITQCAGCNGELKVQKTRNRELWTLHIGEVRAKEVILICKQCGQTHRCEELCSLVPSGANFGYDVMVHVGKALFLRDRNEAEVVAELAERNVQISAREVSLLGMKFIVYLAIAHRRRAAHMAAHMQSRGGYICHLDATCEGRDPLLMSSIDSLSEIVLGNVKLPAEDEAHVAAFLERIKTDFGTPVALVHDMGKGILKAVANVFPDVPDFICHFHFLRDLGKDFLGAEYDTIRTRLSKHGISAALRRRAKDLKAKIDGKAQLIEAIQTGIEEAVLPSEALEFVPIISAYALIQWALRGKSQGHGYGFPFDRSHLDFANRLRRLSAQLEEIKDIHLRGPWRDNCPYFKIHIALKPIIRDKALWKAVEAIEEKITVFEKLRAAMRIAPQSGRCGLNDEGQSCNIRTIEARVKKFRAWLSAHKNYPRNLAAQKMIKQIDKYWEKLFADPITVQTPSGPILIQPQRTNNILEQFFRRLKRAHRRRTGNASSSRMLRTILAETPLVRNLQNSQYMKLLLKEKTSLEALFADIEIKVVREAFREAKNSPEKIPSELKPLIAMPDLPEKLAAMVKRAVV